MQNKERVRTRVILERILFVITVSLLIPILKNDGDVFATINPSGYSATLQVQNQNVPIEITPASFSDEVYASITRTLVVSSTGVSEYKIFAKIPSGQSGSLVLPGGTSSDPSIAQIGANLANATTLNSDTWGFGIPSTTTGLPTNNFSNQYTSGTPSTSSTYASYTLSPTYTLIRDVTSATGNDSFTLYYGMRIGTDVLMHAGTYSSNVEYRLVVNASNVAGGEATISPASGPKAGGDVVTITTSMMTDSVPDGISVTVGGRTCNSPSSSVSSGVLVITCTVQSHHPGATDVVVNVSSLGMTYTITGGYTYIETGEVKITNIQYVSGVNVKGTPSPSVDNNGNIDFDLTFQGGLDNNSTLQATYQLTVTNTTSDDYTFTAPASNLTLRISQNEVRDISYTLSGISVGDIIQSNSSVTFNIILNADYVSCEHGVEGGVEVNPVDQSISNLIGSIHGSNTGNLSGNNNLTSFQIDVESSFDESKSFTIGTLDPDFEIVDSNGNALGAQTIAANTTGTYTFYMKKASGAAFASETATAGIIISYDSEYTNVGEVKITVDKDPSYVDSQAPIISSVTATKNKTVSGEATVSWTGTDNVGVASYSIYRCVPNTSCNTPTVTGISGTASSYTFTNVPAGTYYFIVVGYDDEGNTATQNEIDDVKTSPGPASKSADTTLSWSYSVSGSITNGSLSHTSGSTVNAGGTYEGKITPRSSSGIFSTSYGYPDTISVTMDGVPLNASEYSYTSSGTNAGVVQIPNASGNIVIEATCPEEACLIEGTLVALANGTKKPIEDITYHDLLKVWNYNIGNVGAEYPAWIEKQKTMVGYRLTRLSDGTELKTTGWHGVFDVDANEFISVDNPERFYPGIKIYKVENDILVPVTVESIEYIEEEVNVYHVVSRQYYNIIANDILTTDGTVMLSNLYGFDENIKWPETRNQIISNPDNLYTYEDFEDIGMPRRMFDELRVHEAKYLDVKYGLTLEMFKAYLLKNQLNPHMWLPYDDE